MDAHRSDLVGHYGRNGNVADVILDALRQAGASVEPPIARSTLAGADEFHLGGAAATAAVLDAMELSADDVVLDVGCGVGGPARAMAVTVGCTVVGVDLTPSFVAAATTLSALTGHDDTSFRVADATELGGADGTYSAATMFHVGMNLADKAAVFGEVHRVLRPGGRFAVYDIMRTGPGELSYPLPWSTSPATSHLGTPDDYVAALTSAGFSAGSPVDHRELVDAALERAAADPPTVTLVHLMGPDFPTMIGNLTTAFRAGTVTPIRIVAAA